MCLSLQKVKKTRLWSSSRNAIPIWESTLPHRGKRFKAHSVPIGKITKACHTLVGRIVEAPPLSSRGALVGRLADLLVRRGMGRGRATLWRPSAREKEGALWMGRAGRFRSRRISPASKEAVQVVRSRRRFFVERHGPAAAQRCIFLRDDTKAACFAARVLCRPDASAHQRIGALLAEECAEGERRRKARSALERGVCAGAVEEDPALYSAARARLLGRRPRGAIGALEGCGDEFLREPSVLLEVVRCSEACKRRA